ncbi:P-loop containing nucleoside triphosphate hydrolase protein [Filobasidium floriforme]|uniref:P-loop containing nucleoside triphosphate hydrolase protein n=1 Tax=Filobasidium floriforme TaxID=5210 RepID=UPI001E8CB301|nr:P-loop containing nucleoside triphosphate hydrolase protein [Filobasidium floriforme]KAH8082309.1 P-loop containing nucleoside triphosphate hydrolase protein [Filobasidium floriforme]
MSVELESNGLLGGMEFPAEPNNGLVNNGLLSGLQEDDGLQSNGLLAMMEDDQMLLDIESGVGSLAGSKGGETGLPGVGQSEEGIGSSVPSQYGAESRLSTPLDIDTDTYISSNTNLAGPSKQRVSHQHVYRDDTALRNAQALSLPRMFASTADGKYVSFGRKVRRKWDGVAARPVPKGDKDGRLQLLDVPYHLLLKQIDQDEVERADQTLQANLARQEHVERLERKGKGKDIGQKAMWVDKYRPTKFTDLLGEERCHRDVLSWLKDWDKCVFKSVAPGVQAKKRNRLESNEEFAYFDALGRPKERILLLSGPPGLGKTTLAHIVAKQAGYDAFEINASDDRSAATVTDRIQNAIDAGSGLRSRGKPICVVIDEIDGAAGGGDTSFIKSLIKLIQDVPANKRKKQAAKVLKRPIICICNDLYASSLRPLRQHARIVRFKKAQPQLVVNRLRNICERENMSAETRGLAALVEITEGDVRSCLNTLQFIKSRTTEVTEKSVRKTALGLKDGGASLHGVWHNLFVPVTSKKKRQNGMATGEDGKYVGRLAEVVMSSGDVDRVMQGCFEHYPNLKPIDASIKNVARIHDWIHHYDRLHHRVGKFQEFELMGYMPYAVVPWHTHMAAAANTSRAVDFPKTDYEAFLKSSAIKEIGTALLQSIPANLRTIYNSSSILTELGPYLMRIISPPLKPVNSNLVKADEKATLVRLVDLMIDMNLRFYRDKTEEGQATFRLEPAIDSLVHYDGKRASDIATSRFAVRSLVSQAVDAEVAKRRGAGSGKENKPLHGMFKTAPQEEKPVDLADKPPTDFFGRAKANVLAAVGSKGIDGQPAKKFRVVYKFNEGSSSAVRKPVKMATLL